MDREVGGDPEDRDTRKQRIGERRRERHRNRERQR